MISSDNIKAGVMLAVLGGVAYGVWRMWPTLSKGAAAVTDGVKQVAQKVNPVNPSNVVNSGVTAVGTAVTGDQSWSLGGWVYDVFHPGEYQKIMGSSVKSVGVPSSPGGSVTVSSVRRIDNAIESGAAAPLSPALDPQSWWGTTQEDLGVLGVGP